MLVLRLFSLVVDVIRRRQPHQLHIWPIVVAGGEKTAALQQVGGADTAFEQQPFQTVRQRLQAFVLPEQANRLSQAGNQRKMQMILQALADQRAVDLEFDADFAQMLCWTDAGQHQQFWGPDGAGA
ncbi:hypothetical protein D3C72_1516440 [compost metagenome]